MIKPKTPQDLLKVIKKLKPDEPIDNPKVWYKTQYDHWLGWLEHYDGPGAYGRKTTVKRDAKYAYNHIVCTGMLTYLIKASGMDAEVLKKANEEAAKHKTLMGKSAAVRRVVPWEVMEAQLWDNTNPNPIQKLKRILNLKH